MKRSAKKVFPLVLFSALVLCALAACNSASSDASATPSDPAPAPTPGSTTGGSASTTTEAATTTETPSPEPKPEIKKAACVGDSLTWGNNGNGQTQNTYPANLQKWFGEASGVEFRNYGMNGRMMTDGYSDKTYTDRSYSATAAYSESLAWKPDIVVIALGTNDSGFVPKTNNAWSLSDRNKFVDSAKKMINAYREAGAVEVYLVQPAYTPRTDIGPVLANEVRPLVNKIGKETGVTVIDLFEATEGMDEILVFDKTHLTDEGYDIMARTIGGQLVSDGWLPTGCIPRNPSKK